MSRIRYAASLGLLLVACPEERTEIGANDAGLTPISHPITSTKTATTSAIEPPPPNNVVEPPPAAACAGAPKWVSQPPCIKDGFLYAAGEFKSKSASHLARGTAANRARKRLALAMGAHENDKFKLEGSEIDQIFHCKGNMFALARVRHQADGEFRTCSAQSLEIAKPSKGCPNWTARMAWMDGDTKYGVAPAHKTKQRSLAEQAAVNRARQVVAEMVEVELQLTPAGVTSTAKSTALREKKRSSTECGGARWMMVAFEKG